MNRLLKSLPKTCRSTVMAIREVKDLNKISLDEFCCSLLTYEQEVNEIEKEKKKAAIEKKKSLGLKMSSHQEETSELSCEDEKDEMAIVAKRYKKLVLQKGQ